MSSYSYITSAGWLRPVLEAVHMEDIDCRKRNQDTSMTMWVITFVVFATDLVIVSFLTVREYRKLGMSLAPDASVMSKTAGEAA